MWQDDHDPVRQHLLGNLGAITTFDLIRAIVSRVAIDLEQITITLKPGGLEKLANRHLQIHVSGDSLGLEPIIAPYKTARAKRGAVVLQPVGSQGRLLDLPPLKFKKARPGCHLAG